METILERLAERYGREYNYDCLTEEQQRFPLQSVIASATDASGDYTVSIESLEPPVLSLHDTYTYAFRENRKTAEGWARARLPGYERVAKRTPASVADDTYLFTLPDASQVQVQFVAYHERA